MQDKAENIFSYDGCADDASRSFVYENLEKFFLSYKELNVIVAKDNGEEFIAVSSSEVACKNLDPRMVSYAGDKIYVRKSVLSMLENADRSLRSYCADWRLEVVYGYRHPTIQQESFSEIRKELTKKMSGYSEDDIMEAVHRMVAVPKVAGHPTGGAVDVRIISHDQEYIDVGTDIYDFSKDSYSFSPFISVVAWRNRQLLRNVMLNAGFAPFDGEWWHFSYGDREWAKYYGQAIAVYEPVSKCFL